MFHSTRKSSDHIVHDLPLQGLTLRLDVLEHELPRGRVPRPSENVWERDDAIQVVLYYDAE